MQGDAYPQPLSYVWVKKPSVLWSVEETSTCAHQSITSRAELQNQWFRNSHLNAWMLWDKGKNFLSWAEEFPWPWFKPLTRRNWRPAWYGILKGNFLRNLFWMPFRYTDTDQKQCSGLFSCDILDYLWLCNIKQILWLVMLSHQPWTSASSGYSILLT